MNTLIVSIIAGSVIFLIIYANYSAWKEDQEKETEYEKKIKNLKDGVAKNEGWYKQPKVKMIKHLREIEFTDPEELSELLNAEYPEETLIAIIGNIETVEKEQPLLKKEVKKITAVTCTYEDIKN